jgi:signal transduction histidine kinase
MERNVLQELHATVVALGKCEERSLAGQFALEVMHEIRGPLDALGHLVHLASASTDLSETQEFMRLAKEQISNLHQIAGQSLTLARQTQTATGVDLRALAEAALRIHHRRLASNQIRLERDFDENATITVQPGEILQVISNVIGNAIDALPQNGTLCLRIRKRADRLVLLISDSGHGISPEHLSRLFQTYFSTKQEHGNGFGLALSKKIVDRHGGSIQVRSCVDPARCGTTFRIAFPV